VSGCIPADAAYFTVYEGVKRAYGFNNDELDLMRTASMGAVATLAHDFIITPGDSKKLKSNYRFSD
jgi:hypothetical protein